MLGCIGKQSGESVESVPKKKRKAAVGKICRKLGRPLWEDQVNWDERFLHFTRWCDYYYYYIIIIIEDIYIAQVRKGHK